MDLLAPIREWIDQWRQPKSLGDRGEDAAARFLKRQRYVIVARRQRHKLGELDLIAVDGRTIVFVEVKTRRSDEKGAPMDAVDEDKQRRLTRLALTYLKRHDLLENPARFDVISVRWPDGARAPKIDHVKNAFEAVGEGQMFS